VPGVREYACLVIEVSDAGKRLLAEIVGDRLNGPKVLYDAWAAGQISDGDLRALPGSAAIWLTRSRHSRTASSVTK
jgi:hypothetical protein